MNIDFTQPKETLDLDHGLEGSDKESSIPYDLPVD